MDNGRFNKIKGWIEQQAWVVIIVTFLTILLGILLSELQTKVGWLILSVSLITVLAIFLIVTYFVVRPIFSISVSLVQGIQNTLDKYIGSEKIGWIRTTPQLVTYETHTNASEIWLITDLSEDYIGAPFQEVVSQNLKKGICYTYFIPDKHEIHSRTEQLTKHNNNSPNLKFVYLNDDFFFLVPKFDFAIYDPFNSTGTRIAYIGIPVPGEEGHYHAKVSDDLIDVLIGKLMPLIQNE